MGMKSRSGHFFRTSGGVRMLKLNIQLFAKKEISRKGKKLLSKVTNLKLKNIIVELYRPGATIGDGSTAAAIKYEIKTGKLIGGKSHIKKGLERLKNLERVMSNVELSKKDMKIAKKLHKDLKKALGGNKE